MAVQHNSLTDPLLHEPKGITTATEGQTYVANGSGSGQWTDLDTEVLGDMEITSPVNGQLMQYDSASGKWKNVAPLTLVGEFFPITDETPVGYYLSTDENGVVRKVAVFG